MLCSKSMHNWVSLGVLVVEMVYISPGIAVLLHGLHRLREKNKSPPSPTM